MKEMQKPIIAVSLNAFWVHSEGMSGGDQMAIQVFRRIRHAFGVMHWFTNIDGQQAAQQRVKDIDFSTSPPVFDRLPLGISYVLRTLLALIRLQAKRVDIVYSGSDFFPDVFPAWLYTRFYRKTRWVQCVFHIYPDWRNRPGNKLLNFLGTTMQKFSLALARQSDGIVNINHEVRQVLIDKGFDPGRLIVITPGVDLELVESVAPSMLETDRFDALFLGRLNRSKGIFDLPEIWKYVISNRPGVRLGVIGGGSQEMREKLKRAFSAAGVGNHVVLLGFVESTSIYAMLKSARVFVFPSYEEGFGIAVVEALACGLPVVAWNLSVFTELFGDVVTTVPLGDSVAFAQAITRILVKKPGPEHARRCARKYGWQKASDAMEQWLVGNTKSITTA